MVFNSIPFLVFLPIVLLLYYRLRHRAQNVLLLAASYFFYGWWDWRFLGLLLFTSGFDYYCAQWIEREARPGRRKSILALSILLNMGVLGFFKYYNFFAASLVSLFAVLGWRADLPTLHVILPIGISFYTFLSMSYTIDVYRGHLKASREPVEFLLYVSFFPHLVAGPIVRAAYLLPQCREPRIVKRDEVLNGLWLCLLGLVKKMVIADRLAQVVDWGFAGRQIPYADANAWFVLYAFAFQIYGDFSGYSDIARGVSKLMGFELVHNFGAPYLVTNPAAFWRHWHISLSVWLRDYVYIPLGGNRRGSGRTYRNLLTTMLLGGLWHGAGVAYMLWGLYHGVMLSIHRLVADRRPGRRSAAGDEATEARGAPLRRAALAIGFFHLTCLGWLLFRAGAIAHDRSQWGIVAQYLHALVNFHGAGGVSPLLLPVALLGGMALWMQWKHELMDRFCAWKPAWQAAAVGVALSVITGFGVFEGSSFIYFQF